MMNSKKKYTTVVASAIAFAFLLVAFSGCKKNDWMPVSLHITTAASGLEGPMGVQVDRWGNLWVSESGTDVPDANGDTHNNNGKVVMITPDGQKHDAIIHLASYANVHSNELQGTVHILLNKNTLYVLSGDYLYQADISKFKAGDAPIDAGTLTKEDVAAVVSKIPSANNPEADSHPYNLIIGPDGDLYISDAGANAIIHRKGPNNYVVLAEFPALPNPAFPGVGGPTVQAVPTSIGFDGKDFLVTILTGFPFVPNQAVIYRVTLSGQVSVYQKNFTMLVDQAAGNSKGHIVVQFASSFSLQGGYAPNSGALLWVNGQTVDTLANNLNQPEGIVQVNNHTWYVTSLGDGSVLKATFQ